MNCVFSKVCVPHIRSLSCLSLGWLALTGLLLTPSAIAQPRSAKSSSFVFTPPPPPTTQGAPSGRRQGGASRGDCKNYEGLTALVPIEDEVVRGLTNSSTPRLWFYLPAPINPDLEAEFVLQDQDDNFVYHNEELNWNTDSAGIVSVSISPPETALKANTSYKWTLSLYCDPLKPSASVYVTGLLESVAPNSSTQAGSPFAQAAQDAKDGLWFDSLTALGELRQEEPNNPDFKQSWIELLQQVDLGNLAAEPLL